MRSLSILQFTYKNYQESIMYNYMRKKTQCINGIKLDQIEGSLKQHASQVSASAPSSSAKERPKNPARARRLDNGTTDGDTDTKLRRVIPNRSALESFHWALGAGFTEFHRDFLHVHIFFTPFGSTAIQCYAMSCWRSLPSRGL